MVAIPINENAIMTQMLYDGIKEAKEREKLTRFSRLGASSIGDPCLRAIWYGWREAGASNISGRVYRIFETGHIQEQRVINDLRNAGFTVFSEDSGTGAQFEFTDDSGHFVCKIDGIIKGVPGCEKTPHVLEIKSSNKKNFDEIVKRGVQIAKPEHYYQMQSGMMLSGLTRALYVVICKDDEQYYVERVRVDDSCIEDIKKRIQTVLYSDPIPDRLGSKQSDWRCKYCDYIDICWNDAPMLVHCRTCNNSLIGDGNRWGCSVKRDELTPEAQPLGCSDWTKVIL